jgi:magnesium-protoporphyrin IX monomethyl ester (oxidative) cyclase
MTTTVSQSAIKKTATEETLLTPRFYTTDFEAIAKMDISSQEEELKAMNVDHPEFFKRLERCADRNEELKVIESSNAPKIVKFFRKLPLIAGIFWDLLVLYLIKPIDAEALRGTVR